jgi:hypothetical protein
LSESPREHHKAPFSKLGEAFIAELCRSWETHGKGAIAKVAEKKPEIYLKLVASFVSTEAGPTSDEFEDIADGELAALIMAARAALNARERSGGPGDDQG